jgi:hypothetical protein
MSSDAVRSLLSSAGAHKSWGQTPNRAARTLPGRTRADARFEQMVPPEVTDPAARALAAESLRRAFYKELAAKSAQVRRDRAAARSTDATVFELRRAAAEALAEAEAIEGAL